MEDILNQMEIDELIEAINNNMLQEWIRIREIFKCHGVRFKSDEIYEVEDYDLFYCTYALEELTTCSSILRHYAYMDTESFKKFKYFIVLEDYIHKKINAVSVVGIEDLAFGKCNCYCNDRCKGKVYLVDASSLFCSHGDIL